MTAAARRHHASSLLHRLRTETRDEHDAIERDLDWERRVADRAGYRDMLARLHGFHLAWEPAVAAALGDPGFFEPRRKAGLLASDLNRLGATGEFPRYPRPIAFRGRDEALGSLYVLEGSTLGGQLIARHVAATLGFTGRYHGAYGPAAGAMWRRFQAYLRAQAEDEDAVVDSARRTFGDLRWWLTTA